MSNKNCPLYKEVTKKYIDILGDDLFDIYDRLICQLCGIHISSQFDDEIYYERYKKEIEYNFKCFKQFAKEYGDISYFMNYRREFFRKQKLEKIRSRIC
jgi:hypothetical protein